MKRQRGDERSLLSPSLEFDILRRCSSESGAIKVGVVLTSSAKLILLACRLMVASREGVYSCEIVVEKRFCAEISCVEIYSKCELVR